MAQAESLLTEFADLLELDPDQVGDPEALAGVLDLLDPASRYAAEVLAGRIVAGPFVRLQCARHFRDMRRPEFVWRPDLAARFFRFARGVMRREDGTAIELEPFQKFYAGSLFGWINASDGTRKYRTGYIEQGKGNGKTPLSAAIALYGLTADGEDRAEIWVAASKREQAGILFNDCVAMRANSRELLKKTLVLGGQRPYNITYKKRHSFLRTTSKAKNQSGPRPHMVLVDELHEVGDPKVINLLRSGFKSRRQPLMVCTTNSGSGRTGICFEYRSKSINVLRGTDQDDSWFAYVCALDDDDLPEPDSGVDPLIHLREHPELWPKVNPGLDSILKRTYILGQIADGLQLPSSRNETLRLNFCVWTNSHTSWVPDSMLMLGHAKGRDLEEELKGRECYGGTDLAVTGDVSAFVLVFPPIESDPRWHSLEWYWIPEADVSERSVRDNVPYEFWAREKKVFVTAGNVTDYDYIHDTIIELSGRYNIREIGYDQAHAAHLVSRLGDRLGLNRLVEVKQGYWLSTAINEFERLAKGRLWWHRAHPVTRWMFSNVCVERGSQGRKRINKLRSKEKVDGASATVTALDRALLRKGNKGPGLNAILKRSLEEGSIGRIFGG